MPLKTSLVLMRPRYFLTGSPSKPHQLAFIPIFNAGCARMAGVQSTVWIFAISALLTSRATRKICASRSFSGSPFQCGERRDQMIADRVVLEGEQVVQQVRPSHQFEVRPVFSIPVGSSGMSFRLGIDVELSVDAGPILAQRCRAVAVDLRAVPPMGFGVDEGFRLVRRRPSRASGRTGCGAPASSSRARNPPASAARRSDRPPSDGDCRD